MADTRLSHGTVLVGALQVDHTILDRTGAPYTGQVTARAYLATGNGVTDDTVALQAAITACFAAGGGTVYVAPGSYLVSRQGIASVNGGTNNCPYCLTIPTGVTVRGEVGGTFLVNKGQHKTGSASDICDNVILIQGSNRCGVVGITVQGDSDPGNATHSPDPLLSGVNDTYGSGQGGFGIQVAGTTTAAPWDVTLADLSFTGLRQGTINWGGDNITSSAQIVYGSSVRNINCTLQQAAVLRVMGATACSFADIHGISSGEMAFLNGPFNHCAISDVDWVGSGDLLNNGYACRFIANNAIQDCTDIEMVNFSHTGKRQVGISIQANNAASNWDGLKFCNVSTEQALATGGNGRGLEVLAGASLVVNLEMVNVVLRTPRVDAFYMETPNGARVMLSNCSAESPGGWGFNCNGAGVFLLSTCESHTATLGGVVLNAAGTVRMTTCQMNNLISGAFQISCAAAGSITAVNCNLLGTTGTTGVSVTAGQVHIAECDISGNQTLVSAAAGFLQTSTFRNVKGYSPRGMLNLNSSAAFISPAMGAGGGGATGQPATATNYTNVSGVDIELIVVGAGTVTQWIVTGVGGNLTAAFALNLGQRILLPAGQIFQCTNSAVPTLFAYGL